MLGTLLLLSSLVPGAHAAPMGQIAMPGAYHGDEMPVRADDAWLGLYETAQGYEWRAVAPRFQSEVDPVLDMPGQQTGVEVAVQGEAPLLLVRGVTTLKPGPATRAPVARARMVPGATEDLPGGLWLRATQDDSGAYQLLLEGEDGKSQVLCSHETMYDDTVPTLMLAGDLDGDGKMDLLIDTSNHYNLSRVTLYLSSAAGPNERVAPVAALQTTGC